MNFPKAIINPDKGAQELELRTVPVTVTLTKRHCSDVHYGRMGTEQILLGIQIYQVGLSGESHVCCLWLFVLFVTHHNPPKRFTTVGLSSLTC